MAHILLVEDNIQLAEATRDFLQLQGHEVTVNHGQGVVEQVLATRPDLLILDVELPNETGFSICRRLRDAFPQPILLLTAHTTELDEVTNRLAMRYRIAKFQPEAMRHLIEEGRQPCSPSAS